MKNYEITYSNIPHFMGIKMPVDFEGYQINDSINVLGSDLKITQKGNSTVALANKTQIFVFQELAENG